MIRTLTSALILALAFSAAGCASKQNATAEVPANNQPKQRRARPVYVTGSLIPVNSGQTATGRLRVQTSTNGTPIRINTQSAMRAPAGVSGN